MEMSEGGFRVAPPVIGADCPSPYPQGLGRDGRFPSSSKGSLGFRHRCSWLPRLRELADRLACRHMSPPREYRTNPDKNHSERKSRILRMRISPTSRSDCRYYRAKPPLNALSLPSACHGALPAHYRRQYWTPSTSALTRGAKGRDATRFRRVLEQVNR